MCIRDSRLFLVRNVFRVFADPAPPHHYNEVSIPMAVIDQTSISGKLTPAFKDLYLSRRGTLSDHRFCSARPQLLGVSELRTWCRLSQRMHTRFSFCRCCRHQQITEAILCFSFNYAGGKNLWIKGRISLVTQDPHTRVLLTLGLINYKRIENASAPWWVRPAIVSENYGQSND